MASGRTKRTPKRRKIFLENLAKGVSVTGSAIAAGLARASVYEWRDDDPEFAEEWDDAVEQGTDLLEDEVRRRSTQGVDEPVFYKGVIVGHVRKYSDQMAMFLLKGRRAEIFRDVAKPEADQNLIPDLIASIKEANRLANGTEAEADEQADPASPVQQEGPEVSS
jgi:hypothetical protein